MLEMGLVDEVTALRQRGYDCHLKAMQSIGYRHVCDYLKGRTSYDEMVTLLKRDTRRYAKRQFTWFRKDAHIIWVEPDDMERSERLVADFMGKNG